MRTCFDVWTISFSPDAPPPPPPSLKRWRETPWTTARRENAKPAVRRATGPDDPCVWQLINYLVARPTQFIFPRIRRPASKTFDAWHKRLSSAFFFIFASSTDTSYWRTVGRTPRRLATGNDQSQTTKGAAPTGAPDHRELPVPSRNDISGPYGQMGGGGGGGNALKHDARTAGKYGIETPFRRRRFTADSRRTLEIRSVNAVLTDRPLRAHGSGTRINYYSKVKERNVTTRSVLNLK